MVLQTKKIDNVDVIISQLKTHWKIIVIGIIYGDRKLYYKIIEVGNSFESVIFGDFNLAVNAWECRLKSHMVHDWNNDLLESGQSQHVNKHTRGDNVLDRVFSTNNSLVSNVTTGPGFRTSDHKIVTYNVKFEVYKENVSEELIYIYRKGNFEKLRKVLSDTDWSIVENEIDINEWKFYNILNGIDVTLW